MSERPRKDRTGPKSSKGEFPFDPELLEFLVCPVTKSPLRYDRRAQELISDAAGLAYPIRDGIPVMLPDQARRRKKTAGN